MKSFNPLTDTYLHLFFPRKYFVDATPNVSSNRLENVISSLHSLHEKFRACFEGKVATYIPELSKADPSWFGIALVDVNGQVIEIGDTSIEFTIQSVSKAVVFGAALDALGRE